MNASDTLKVRKVRFFIEPKATFIIPMHRHITNSYLVDAEDMDPISVPNYIETDNWKNKSTINFGFSGGLSIRLSKHFNYELSLAYSHYNVKTKVTESATDLSGNYLFGGTTYFSSSFNSLFISNGLSYKYKKFIFTNSIMIGAIAQATLYNIVSNYYNCSLDWYLMSEHKIGYSLFKNKIEAYAGINVLPFSPFSDSFTHPTWDSNQNYTPKSSLIPFTSVRINF